MVGANNRSYEFERARNLADEAEPGHSAEFLECDFLHIDAPDDSLDAAYSIEATVHALTKVG